jgi:hypothetical protein
LNWIAQNAATSGQWMRGVPVNDPDWPYDPHADADNSGQCFLTQNVIGVATDVSNGTVRLYSPLIDLSTLDDAVISYWYYLHSSAAGAADPMVVSVSSNDLNGPWIEIGRHDLSGGNNWRQHSISKAELDAGGVSLTSTMRLRVFVTDGSPQSIVEAGFDGLWFSTDCGGPPTECAPDISPEGGNNEVDVDDLLAVINAWGDCEAPPSNCAGDIVETGVVDVDDLLAVINAWGRCE